MSILARRKAFPVIDCSCRHGEDWQVDKLTVRDLDLKGKRVFLRLDLNVPLDQEQRIVDDTRIVEALPTIEYVVGRGGRAILASHLGRPRGKRVEALSLRPVAKRLKELLRQKVAMAEDCVGEGVTSQVQAMKDGDVLLLENLRFHAEETANDPAFSRQLAELADVYVNDAFGTAHRAHASTAGITQYVPLNAAGLLLEREIEYLTRITARPDRPFIACLGGAKVADKLETISSMLERVDALVVGGKMAYTFLAAKGETLPESLIEQDKIAETRNAMEKAEQRGVEILLPADHVVAKEASDEAEAQTVTTQSIPDGWLPLDIGPDTRSAFGAKLGEGKTIFWNGPMGLYEVNRFSAGTVAVAEAIVRSGALTVLGGGDSIAAAKKAGCLDQFTHVSTGGGALLDFLRGEDLPGLSSLTDR